MASVVSTKALRNLGIILHLATDRDFSDAEWKDYLAVIEELKKKNGGDPSRIRTFVVTDGAAPNALQRKAAGDLFAGHPNKIAVLTNSTFHPLTRGVATAFSWINPLFKSLPPEKWREGLEHIDLVEADAKPMLEELLRMQKGLPEIKSLELFRSYAGATGGSVRPR